jgi:hypothetical protein
MEVNMKLNALLSLLLMFFLLSCEQKDNAKSNANNNLLKADTKSSEIDSVVHKQNEPEAKDSLFRAFCSKLNDIQMPLSSKSSQIPLIKKRYPEINVDTAKVVAYPYIKNFYEIAKKYDAYEESEIYAIGKIPMKNSDNIAIVYLYQNAYDYPEEYLRPEPEVELVIYTSEGVIIDRLLLHYFDCGDGITSKHFSFNNDTIKITDVDISYDEKFTHATTSISVSLYSIKNDGKFSSIGKEQYKINNFNDMYNFEKEEIYESVFMNTNFPRAELPNAQINSKNGEAELFYHTWSPAVNAIENGEKVFYIALPKLYGDYFLIRLENEEQNYFIKKQDITPLDYETL